MYGRYFKSVGFTLSKQMFFRIVCSNVLLKSVFKLLFYRQNFTIHIYHLYTFSSFICKRHILKEKQIL